MNAQWKLYAYSDFLRQQMHMQLQNGAAPAGPVTAAGTGSAARALAGRRLGAYIVGPGPGPETSMSQSTIDRRPGLGARMGPSPYQYQEAARALAGP